MDASSSKGTKDAHVNRNQELKQEGEDAASEWWWWSDLHALRRLLYALVIAFQIQEDKRRTNKAAVTATATAMAATMMTPLALAGRSSDQSRVTVMASASERSPEEEEEEPTKWTSWCDNCMRQHHELISNRSSSIKLDAGRREDVDDDDDDGKLLLRFMDKAAPLMEGTTPRHLQRMTSVSSRREVEHKPSSRPSPALLRRSEALKRPQKADECSMRSGNSKALPEATPERRAPPRQRHSSDDQRKGGGGVRSPTRRKSPGRRSNGSTRLTSTRQKGSRRVAGQLGASDVGSSRRQQPSGGLATDVGTKDRKSITPPPTRDNGVDAPPRKRTDVMPRPPPKHNRPQKEAMEAAATLQDQTTLGENRRAAMRDGFSELARQSSCKNTTAGSGSSSKRPGQSETEQWRRAASPSPGQTGEAAAGKKKATNLPSQARPHPRELLLPRVQSWSSSSSSSSSSSASSSSSSQYCPTPTASSDAAERRRRRLCSTSTRQTVKTTTTAKRAAGNTAMTSGDINSSSDRSCTASRRALVRRQPAPTGRSESMSQRDRSMSRHRLPSQRRPLREPSQRLEKVPPRKTTGAGSSSRLARTDEQKPEKALVVRGHGRLRRIKNKLAVIFHHHHHLHDGRAADGGDADWQRRRRRLHDGSAWEFLKSIISHRRGASELHQHGGHLHALVRGLIRHMWGAGELRSSSPPASRAVAKRAAGKKKKKVHWWRRLRRHGGLKLAKARKRTRPKLRVQRPPFR